MWQIAGMDHEGRSLGWRFRLPAACDYTEQARQGSCCFYLSLCSSHSSKTSENSGGSTWKIDSNASSWIWHPSTFDLLPKSLWPFLHYSFFPPLPQSLFNLTSRMTCGLCAWRATASAVPPCIAVTLWWLNRPANWPLNCISVLDNLTIAAAERRPSVTPHTSYYKTP